MKQNRLKILTASGIYLFLMTSARVLGATNDVAITPLPATDIQAGIITAMFHQVATNPSSGLVIAALCVFAWLTDDLPFIPSRYVAHLTVIVGAFTFRFFCLESSVPVYFPHPQAVFCVNGIIAGFIAFTVHKQIVARTINFFRVQGGTASPDQKRTELKPTDVN